MICYKDKTFCNSVCKNKECDIKLTDKIRREAKAFGLPICIINFNCKNKK